METSEDDLDASQHDWDDVQDDHTDQYSYEHRVSDSGKPDRDTDHKQSNAETATNAVSSPYKKPFPLFKLTTELRLEVYRHALSRPSHVLHGSYRRGWPGVFEGGWELHTYRNHHPNIDFGNPALLRTSKQVYEEAIEYLYTTDITFSDLHVFTHWYIKSGRSQRYLRNTTIRLDQSNIHRMLCDSDDFRAFVTLMEHLRRGDLVVKEVRCLKYPRFDGLAHLRRFEDHPPHMTWKWEDKRLQGFQMIRDFLEDPNMNDCPFREFFAAANVEMVVDFARWPPRSKEDDEHYKQMLRLQSAVVEVMLPDTPCVCIHP